MAQAFLDRSSWLIGAAVIAIAVAGSGAGNVQAPSAAQPRPAAESLSEKARRLHKAALVIDGHMGTTNRTLMEGWRFTDRHPAPPARVNPTREANHVDLPRMRDGGLDAAFFGFAVGGLTGPAAIKAALERIDAVHRLAEQVPRDIALCLTAADVRRAHREGKIAALIGMEGGLMIDDSLAVLRDYRRLGVRYLTLTHGRNTNWADSSTDQPVHGGLTDFGKQVVRELNRLGIMVDISHVADSTFSAALEVSVAPLLASHSSARALSSHPRNMSDEMIKALGAKGGVMMINYLVAYLDEQYYQAQQKLQPEADAIRRQLEERFPGSENAATRREKLDLWIAERLPKVPWTRIVDHIEHAVRLAGVDHVGLGSDFDAANMPEGLEDVSQLPKITEELLRRGYSEADIKKILGENVLRLMEKVEAIGKELRGERGVS